MAPSAIYRPPVPDVSHLCFPSYMIDGAVCYLTLCSREYSKRLAFSYLENIAQEFQSQYSRQVHTVSRPYSFIEFGEYSGEGSGERVSWMDVLLLKLVSGYGRSLCCEWLLVGQTIVSLCSMFPSLLN